MSDEVQLLRDAAQRLRAGVPLVNLNDKAIAGFLQDTADGWHPWGGAETSADDGAVALARAIMAVPSEEVKHECTCDSPGGEFAHRDWCELNHPNHLCDELACRHAPDRTTQEKLLAVLCKAAEDWDAMGGASQFVSCTFWEWMVDRLIRSGLIRASSTGASRE